MLNKDEVSAQLMELLKQPYSDRNMLTIYKDIHRLLDFGYTDNVDYDMHYKSESYIKNPIHLVIDICMSQLSGLLHAAYELVIQKTSAPKYPLNLEEFLDVAIDLGIVTLITYTADPVDLGLPCTLDEKVQKVLCAGDKNLVLIFQKEVSVLLTLAVTAITLLHSKEQALAFKKTTDEWTTDITNVFQTTLMTKNMQTGG